MFAIQVKKSARHQDIPEAFLIPTAAQRESTLAALATLLIDYDVYNEAAQCETSMRWSSSILDNAAHPDRQLDAWVTLSCVDAVQFFEDGSTVFFFVLDTEPEGEGFDPRMN